MGGIVSGITGALGLTADPNEGRGEMKAAENLSAQARAALEKIDVPAIEAQRILLEYPELILSTDEEKLSGSELAKIQEDLRLSDAQMDALAGLREISEQGFTAEDKARFEALRTQVAQDEQARQASILAGMAERGALDSGAQLAAQLSSAQAATQRANQEANQMAGQAAQRRQSALQQMGSMAGGMQQQQFQRDATKASAKDAINQFNAAVAAGDTAARRAQAADRASIANQQEMFNKGLQQQKFQNELSKATGVANQFNNQAGVVAGMGQAAAQGAQAQAAGNRGLLIGGAKAAIGTGGLFKDGGYKLEDGVASYDDYEFNRDEDTIDGREVTTETIGLSEEAVDKMDSEKEIPKITDEIEEKVAKKYNKDKSDDMQYRANALLDAFKPQQTKTTIAPPKFNTLQTPSVDGINPADLLNKAKQMQFQTGKFEDGGMNYESGGNGTIIESGDDNYAGDELPDRINDGEMVLNIEQQDKLNRLLQDYARVKNGGRIDEDIESGKMKVNPEQQEALFETIKGNRAVEDLPKQDVVMPNDMSDDSLESILLGENFQDGGMPIQPTSEMMLTPEQKAMAEQLTGQAVNQGIMQGLVEALKELSPQEIPAALDKLRQMGIDPDQLGISFADGGLKLRDGIPGYQTPKQVMDLVENLTETENINEIQEPEMDNLTFVNEDPVEFKSQRVEQSKAPLFDDKVLEDQVSTITTEPPKTSSKPKSLEERFDDELKSAKKNEVLINLLDDINQSLAYYDAANPWVKSQVRQMPRSNVNLVKNVMDKYKMLQNKRDKKLQREAASKGSTVGTKVTVADKDGKPRLQIVNRDTGDLIKDLGPAVGQERLKEQFEFNKQMKKRLSDSQVEKVESLKFAEDLTGEMEKQLPKVEKFLGPYASRIEEASRYIPGVERDPEFVKFQANAVEALASYIKDKSGAQVSDRERAFLEGALPSVTDKPGEFKAKLEEFQKRLGMVREGRFESFAKQGKEIMSGKEVQPINKPESVLLEAPDGTQMRVRSDKVQKYLDKGAKVIKE